MHYKTCSKKLQSCNVWFQKISIPLARMVLPNRPPHPLGISVPEGSCITPHLPGISYFPFHGLYLSHLEIIERVPLKINCSHLKTQFFIIFDLFGIFYKAMCILTQVEQAYEQSLFFISPSSKMREARKHWLICYVISRKHYFTA